MTVSRRTVFKSALVGAATLPLAAVAGAEPASQGNGGRGGERKAPLWGKGFEGQRTADLGNGTFLNPIVAGDHPDPTILKDGKDYYMTFSSFLSYPGLVIWHSRDLVNWRPLGAALMKNLGSVYACDLIKHDGRYFIYIPAISDENGVATYAIWADRIEGPWSDPVDLGIRGYIDPGHIVGEDGKRYLFVNGIRKVRLTDDGLAADGPVEDAYDPWRYPEDWVVENFAPEGPKLLRRGDYFYLVTAVGGTAGPPTGHMVIAARSRSVHGPWEHCPHNPLVRTQSADEAWWSRGHASLVEGPTGDWWMVYHGYENGHRTLGRQTLLEPIEWTADGWFRAKGGDLSEPIRKPAGGEPGPSGMPLSDDFSRNRFGMQWSFHQTTADETERASYHAGGLRIAARGTSPADSAPLTCTVGDRAYEAEVSVELEDGAEGGLLLFYNHKAFVGVGFDGEVVKTFAQSEEQSWFRKPLAARRLRFKVTNDNDVVTFRYSADSGRTWNLIDLRMEVSGYNQNTFGGFLALRVGLYSAGKGGITLSDFRYRALGSS